MRALTVALFFLSFSALAQNNSIHVYPWNPDSDQDNHIGVEDLQSFLTVYGNDFGLPPEPCTYDGTNIEDLIIGLFQGDDSIIILDSIFVEYTLEGEHTYFLAGCPEPVVDTIIYSWNGMFTDWWVQGNTAVLYYYSSTVTSWNGSAASCNFQFSFNDENGDYYIGYSDYIVSALNLCEPFCGNLITWHSYLPFSGLTLDESGIVFEDIAELDMADYITNLSMIPYWHYADE